MKIYLLAMLLLQIVTSTASAGFILSFSPSTDEIMVGQSTAVELILTQTAPVGGVDITSNGLVGVDIELLLSSPVASVTAITPGSGFEDSLIGSDPNLPLMSIQSTDPIDGVRGASLPTSILLGTFTFTGTSVGTMTATTVDTGFTEFVFALDPSPDFDIDDLIFGTESFTLTVSAIPEPTSLVMLGLSGLVLLARRSRPAA